MKLPCQNESHSFSCFDRTPTCDGQTGTGRHRAVAIVSALAHGTCTDSGLQSDPVHDRLLQCCAPRRSKVQYQEAAASAEQRSSDRSRGFKTIPRQRVAEDVTLVARLAEDRLQSGSANVQNPQHIDAVVPPSPNPGPTTQPQPAIDYCDLSRRRLLRSVLTDAVLRLSRTHYRKTVVDSDSVVVFKSVQVKDIPLLQGFLSSLFSVAHCLAPAPLTLRPDGAIQTRLLLLFFLFF